MYYDTQRKLAFVMPPRTGTTTFENLLTSWGAQLVAPSKHSKPSEVQFDGFSPQETYGFYRDPLDRFLSLFRYMRNRIHEWDFVTIPSGISANQIAESNDDELLELFPKYNTLIHNYFDLQNDWLANATALDFNNYTVEVLRVARMFDVKQVNLAVHNWTENAGVTPSQKLIDFVQAQYADDYRLGRERGLLA